jgi:hypothetical protein
VLPEGSELALGSLGPRQGAAGQAHGFAAGALVVPHALRKSRARATKIPRRSPWFTINVGGMFSVGSIDCAMTSFPAAAWFVKVTPAF